MRGDKQKYLLYNDICEDSASFALSCLNSDTYGRKDT